MSWVNENLVDTSIAGTSPASGDVISKEFHCEDPRFLSVTIDGALLAATCSLETRSGSGDWNAITVGVSFMGTDTLSFVATTELLQDQVRVKTTGGAVVDKVYVCRKVS